MFMYCILYKCKKKKKTSKDKKITSPRTSWIVASQIYLASRILKLKLQKNYTLIKITVNIFVKKFIPKPSL